ncbi:hypothetical protein BDV26DRAFT_299438 [Aspergillus bertholletiae]|uniref:Uncharacterized protein n=1 Tax=Aspergillus bertholletiae TaxID=1226010 RepID=A0A5N7BLA8_9EURO|nr:hypothetical protein BDV26DRAFT_299438 [Aspergillus bertholletiae]
MPSTAPKASVLSKLWAKYGIDLGTFLVITKGVLPAVICVAMFEAAPVAKLYTTVGYLNSIIAALSFCFLPRAKFFQLSILNVVGTCIGAAMSLLLMYCATQARIHTTPPAATAQLMQALSEASSDPSEVSILSLPYNSSASAVSGIWLFFGVWISTAIRARRPQLIFPVVMFNIFINVSATYGALLPTMGLCMSLVKQVLLSMLTGLGISFGVGIFFTPTTSRMIACKIIVGYIGLLKVIIHGEQGRVDRLKSRRIYRVETATSVPNIPHDASSSTGIAGALQQLASTHRALETEIACVARELEFNRLSAENFGQILRNLGAVAFQVRGLDTIADVLEQNATIQERRINEGFDITTSDVEGGEKYCNNQLSVIIYENANTLFSEVAGLLEESLDHFLLTLEMAPPALRKSWQRKADSDHTRDPGYFPGGASFSTYLQQKLQMVHSQALENFDNVRLLSKKQHMNADTGNPDHGLDGSGAQELYLLLHMQAMLESTGKCVLKFVQAADRIRGDEKAFKNALRYPSLPTLKLWARTLFMTQNTDVDMMDRQAKSSFGELYHGFKDLERVPSTTLWERLVSNIERSYRFFGSEESQLGFRAACATMSIGIVAFLQSGQEFFIKQRLLWASITVAVAFTPSSGSATRGLIWRIVGTVVAMVLSIVNYYIFPRYLIAGLLALVTHVLIIGYELQVRKIGHKAAETNGQPVYPIYQLAPYRLLTVIGGCFSAFIWTIFPSVVTDAYRIRTKLGLAFELLGHYYTCSQAVWDIDLTALAGYDSLPPISQQRAELVKMRVKLFSQILVLLEEVKLHLNDSSWDLQLGAKFPKQKYAQIAYHIQSIVSHIGLIGTTGDLLSEASKEDSRSASNHDWRDHVVQTLLSRRSDEVVCVFSMLAASLSGGKPLPPCSTPRMYITPPEADKLLGLDHVAETEFVVYAASSVFSELWRKELQVVIEDVRDLTGEFRFSVLDSISIDQGLKAA